MLRDCFGSGTTMTMTTMMTKTTKRQHGDLYTPLGFQRCGPKSKLQLATGPRDLLPLFIPPWVFTRIWFKVDISVDIASWERL